MPTNLTLSASSLYGFLLVLVRVSGALVFVPFPGLSSMAGTVKMAFSLGFTLALAGRWPVVEAAGVSPARLAGWAGAEAAIGIAIGVSVAIVFEAFLLAAQVISRYQVRRVKPY